MARIISLGEFASEGERRAAEILTGLPKEWIVIANKVLPASNDRSFEIDFIVLGDHLIFAIDEKSWRGRIHGSDAAWVREDGSSQRSPLNKIDYVAKVLASYIRSKVALPFGDQHFTRGCVLLSAAEQRPAVRDPRAGDGVLLLTDAVERLKRVDASERSVSLVTVRERIQRALFDLSDRPKIPRAVGPYRIDEVLAERNGSRVLRAAHADTGAERLLTVHSLNGSDSVERERALREFTALQRLRETGVVPEVLDPFTWSDDFLVVPAAPPAGMPLSTLPKSEGQEAGADEVALAAAAFRALAKVHGEGVVHRALSPDSIYVRGNGKPEFQFTDFHAARHGTGTISSRLDELRIIDPYAAPEIGIGYAYATPESDTYSLALVFLERLSGTPVKELVRPDGSVEIRADRGTWDFLPEPVVEQLADFFRSALSRGPLAGAGSPEAQRMTAVECVEALGAIERRLRTDGKIAKKHLLDRRYRVERVLGVGASARTFLVTDTEADGLFAVKQYLRPDIMRDTGEAKREFGVLRNLVSPHLPRVYDVYPPDSEIHVKMEYVQGVPLEDRLRSYEGEGQLDRWRRLAADLFAAVELLERHGLVHRDIKPSNVLIRDGDERAVLVDFGAAVEVTTTTEAAGTFLYIPPEALFADRPSRSGDQYALGVLLFLALTGATPFQEGIDQQCLVPVEALPGWLQPYARVLLRAVDPDPTNRYESVASFKQALLAVQPGGVEEAGDPALEDHVAPWVDDLRRLYRNSVHGNADNRGLDSAFARETYVRTALDERLLPAVLRDRPRVVFLSGNPGDGKTAFLEQVQAELRRSGGTPNWEDDSGWDWQLDGHSFRACYDASEANEGMSADEQLASKLDGLQGDTPPRSDLTVLVAINDGRLADFAEHQSKEFPWIAYELERAQLGASEDEPGGVWLVDLKRRAYVALQANRDHPSVLARMVAVFTAQERWQICRGCSAQHVCPIRRNAQMLGGWNGEEVAARLEQVLTLAHLRGERHNTMRDLRSGLAYLVTGDTGCEQIHDALHEGRPMPNVDYWRLAFSTDERHDLMLGELGPMDPARFAHPRLERFLYFHQAPGYTPLRAELFSDQSDLPPTEDIRGWIGQVKQRMYFEGAAPDYPRLDVPRQPPGALLPYRYAHAFVTALARGDGPRSLLGRVVRGIGRSDGIAGPALEGGLCLRVIHSDTQQLTVLKRFPLEEFDLEVYHRAGSDQIESIPEALLLRHRKSAGQLRITLDLFELLMRFAGGLEPDSPEFQPLLEDMGPFKSAVTLSNTRDLVLIEGERRMHRLTQESGKVVRLPLEVSR